MKLRRLTKDSVMRRNLSYAREHLLAIIANPALLDEIPNGASVVFVPQNDAALARYNRYLGRQQEQRGRKVIYQPVRRLAANAAD